MVWENDQLHRIRKTIAVSYGRFEDPFVQSLEVDDSFNCNLNESLLRNVERTRRRYIQASKRIDYWIVQIGIGVVEFVSKKRMHRNSLRDRKDVRSAPSTPVVSFHKSG